ncbi:MAG: aldo/keto reductase [Leptospiraceae bacterium]|nr:aldo/keto reductase [Leptospiraceae bacterium]
MIPRVKFHATSKEFSELVYGVWRLAEDERGTSEKIVQEKIEFCLENGITTFDHADIYGNYTCEEIFGRVLKQNKSLISKMEIVTKCGIMLISSNRPNNRIKHYNTTKTHILQSVETSLNNLEIERIDLLLIHRPNPILDPEEVASAFYELQNSGKVLHFGVSNFLPHQVETLQKYLDFPLITNQIELSPLHIAPFTDGILDDCLQRQISPMAWSPFGGGWLLQEKDEVSIRVMNVVKKLAKQYGFTEEEIILKWLTFSPHRIVPVVGTNKIHRMKRYLRYAQVPMDIQDWFEIYSASLGREVP